MVVCLITQFLLHCNPSSCLMMDEPATGTTLGTHLARHSMSPYEGGEGVAFHHLRCDSRSPRVGPGSLRIRNQVRSGSSLGNVTLLDG